MEANVVLIHPKDNVVVAAREIQAGENLTGVGEKKVKVLEAILKNHKVAITAILENDPVVKYGVPLFRNIC